MPRISLIERIRQARAIVWLGRCAYAGRGLAYIVVGGFVVYTAASQQTAQGWKAAFATVRSLPAGIPVVLILSAALALFIVWRLVEALLDPEHLEHDLRGLALRGLRLCSAIAYASITWRSLQVLFRQPTGSDDSHARQAAAIAMSEPLGRWLVLVIGIVVLVIALVWIARSITLDVNKRLGQADEELSPWLATLGRLGHLARGFVLSVIGGFFVYAAWLYQPQQARSMSGALQAIEHQPFGDWLLAGVGIGLLAFGLFGLAVARYRRFNFGSGGARKLGNRTPSTTETE